MKIVDEIPAECCRKRRRPTLATERSERSDGDLSDIVVLALSGDSQSESTVRDRLHHDDKGTPCSTPPALVIEMDEMMDLSVEKLLRRSSLESTTSSRLATLLEDNQRALQLLLEAKEGGSSNLKEDKCGPCTPTSPKISWKEAFQFELQHAVPGVVAMVLYCVAHAATYELVSNLAYEAVEKAPNEDGSYSQPWGIYTSMLILGCLLARFSGVVWNFASPMNYNQVRLVYHNRIRLGAKDARFLHWLHQQGEGLYGVASLVSYYLCYIAVSFFVGQVATMSDQRQDILSSLPSTLYQQSLGSGVCSAEESKAEDHWLLQNDTAGCFYLKETENLDIFGPEDDLYFFHALSKNSYENFFGQDYHAPLFDSTHQILFFGSVAVMAVYTLKACLGYSFWAGW